MCVHVRTPGVCVHVCVCACVCVHRCWHVRLYLGVNVGDDSCLLNDLVSLIPVAALHGALDGQIMLTIDILKDAVLVL